MISSGGITMDNQEKHKAVFQLFCKENGLAEEDYLRIHHPLYINWLENKIDIPEQQQEKIEDPYADMKEYFVEEWPFEVWDYHYRERLLVFFSMFFETGEPGFVARADEIGSRLRLKTFKHVRPLNTIFDVFLWAEWTAIDRSGRMYAYSGEPIKRMDTWGSDAEYTYIRTIENYDGDWTQSLRKRPSWACNVLP